MFPSPMEISSSLCPCASHLERRFAHVLPIWSVG
jgi:hypothetical protein